MLLSWSSHADPAVQEPHNPRPSRSTTSNSVGQCMIQSRHVPQQNNFSTQNNFSQNDFSQNNFSTQNTFLTDDWHELWLRTWNPFFFISWRSPRTCTSQKGFSTQKCRERALLHIIEILRLSDLIYPKSKPS